MSFSKKESIWGKKQKKGGAFSWVYRRRKGAREKNVWVPRMEKVTVGSPSAPGQVCAVSRDPQKSVLW